MKIGTLDFKSYAAKKPLAVSPLGKFLTASEIVAQPSLGSGSLFALGSDLQLKLALERYEAEPNFKLAIIGVGLVTKDEVIENIKGQTEFGQFAVRAELQYCNELIASLAGGAVAAWPVQAVKPLPVVPNWKPVQKCIVLKVPTRALFCENTTDGVTTPFANYRIANVHPVFQTRGFTMVVLTGSNDVRSKFVPEAKNGATVYISGIGHGNYTTYTGNYGDHILEVGLYDPAEVKGKAIHFLSCETSGKLGPDTVAKGAKSYVGYTENFILQWDDGSTPAINEFQLFAKSDSTFDIWMANGATAQQAYDATVQAFNAAIAQVPGTVAATYLTSDRNHLKLDGDSTTAILPYRYVKICYPIKTLEMQNALIAVGEMAD